MTKQQFKQHIESFDFTTLFTQLGWAPTKGTAAVKAKEETYIIESVAQKNGFSILICQPGKNGTIPGHLTRLKIDNEVSRLFKQHLLVFINGIKTQQVWQILHREINKPVKLRAVTWSKGQGPEILYQKAGGLLFRLEGEDVIAMGDIVTRVPENFFQHNEKITKQFYDRFKKERTSFLSFIKGIKEKTDRDWYASLILNRLMFCYFIQKKGFLDDNKNYLRDKLKRCRQKKGKNKFHSFYRSFLLVLFHKGLNEPAQKEKIITEIGKIPYLDGGIFDEHDLEKSYKIDIDDKAFERLFDFFDQYEWRPDTRITATDKDINPDVIGYIFEKYINDRAQMGAYYTREDITDYISKNCIIPWLFDETARHHASAFAADGEIWQLLKESGDKYIYDAVKFGVNQPLPENITAGIHVIANRTEWNKQAPAEIGLPTEIWREVLERRKRYDELKAKIGNGEVTAINDFITLNLDIRQFIQDVIENSNDTLFIKTVYKALTRVTIIDPTCGSGAFLFAAMNILEPLYHACIMRMRAFTEDEDRENELKKKTFSTKYKFFREVLGNIQSEQQPNLQYFIYKTIILNNLYGVDIMREAVEIAKLRLFLKLVATVEADYKKKNLGLDPLPDIDFNIRAGNTLAGFSNKDDVEKAARNLTDGLGMVPIIDEKSKIVAAAFKNYKEIRLTYGEDFKNLKKTKTELLNRLNQLNSELNKLLHKQASGSRYENWLETYSPFHWFAEFYEIIHINGGFDVIIGNPPYIGVKKMDYDLKLPDFKSSDLFGYVIRKCFQILKDNARYGFIVMHNLAFSRNFSAVRKVISANSSAAWFSFFARIPAGLFSGDVRVRNCVFLLEKREDKKENKFYSTRIQRWFTDARDALFDKMNYSRFAFKDIIPMYNSHCLANYFETAKGKSLSHFEVSSSKNTLYFKQSAYNWVAVSHEPAPCYDGKNKKITQSQVSEMSFCDRESFNFSLLLLNGKLFFSQWLTFGDEFHVTRDDLSSVKVPYEDISIKDKNTLTALSKQFAESLNSTIQFKLNAGKRVGTFNTSKLWHITDQSDKIFLKYLCDNYNEVFEAIETHVAQTVITVTDNDDN